MRRGDFTRRCVRRVGCVLILCVICFFAGLWASQWFDGNYESHAIETVEISAIIDTAKISKPVALSSIPLSPTTVRLPKYHPAIVNPRYYPQKRQTGKVINVEMEGCMDEESISVEESSDSIEVPLPMEQRYYRGEAYEAWVSGFNPALDSINIFHHTSVVTTAIRKNKRGRWGLSAGVGMSVGAKNIEPCIFVGLTYTFITF